jgi:hypothetical protein
MPPSFSRPVYVRASRGTQAHPRSHPYPALHTPRLVAAQSRLRAKAGEPCREPGQWQSLDTPHQIRTYRLGEPTANLHLNYRTTIWQYVEP